jgi:hypothetical protein
MIKIPANAERAVCPTCQSRFRMGAGKDKNQSLFSGVSLPGLALPDWINPWGLAAFVFATAALLTASLVGERLLTMGLAGLGLACVLPGFVGPKDKRHVKDSTWLAFGGGISGLILCLAVISPGTLNNRWAVDFAVAEPERDVHIAAPKDDPNGQGRTLAKDEEADAAGEVVRHNSLSLRVESVKEGRLPDKGAASYALIHLQFANIGSEAVSFKGFAKDGVEPTLSDTSGRAYNFIEYRQRLRTQGDPFFAAPKPGTVQLQATESQGCLLVFELPAAGLKTLKLELPASAWGRQGVYRFSVGGPF